MAVLFGNISEWGPKALSWLLALHDKERADHQRIFHPWDVVCIAEHRLTFQALQELSSYLAKHGWRVMGTAAGTGSGGGTSGGR